MKRSARLVLVTLAVSGCLDRDPAEPSVESGVPEIYPARAWIETGGSTPLGLTFPSPFTVRAYQPEVASFQGTAVHANRPGTATLEAFFALGRRRSEITVVPPIQPLRGELVDEGLSDASLLGVWSASRQTTFAVGANGVILRTDDAGATWTLMPSGTTATLTAVWGSGVNDVFAVGSGGIIHWDGTGWRPQTAPTSDALLDVFGFGPNQVYAVGVNAALVFDGVRWRRMPGIGTAELWSIWGPNPNELFAVGQNGLILAWDGVTWRSQPSPTALVLFGLWGTAGNDVYAVGIRGLVLHYNGLAWDSVRVPSTADFFAVAGTSKTNIMIVGNTGVVLSFDGAAWTQVPQTASRENLRAIAFDPSGLARVAAWSGTVIERDLFGVGWRSLVTAPSLLSGLVLPDGTRYAVGTGGAIIRRQNGITTRIPIASPRDLYGITRTADGTLIVVGDSGTVLSSKLGQVWTAEPVPATGLVRSIWADRTDPSAVYAVGAGGLILRRMGGQWSRVVSPSGIFFRHVFGLAPNEIVAVGDSGTIVRFDGRTWSPMASPTKARLRGVWGTATNDLIAVGDIGTALRFDGRTWYPIPTGTTKDLRAVAGTGPTDVYAIGEDGTALRFNGATWAKIALTRSPFLLGLTTTDAGDLTAVGTNRTLIRFAR